jgi:hypothetical protein
VGLVDRFALDVDTLEKKGDNRANARLKRLLNSGDGRSSLFRPIADVRQHRAKNSPPNASEIFSAIMIVGRFVLADGIVGMSEASQI